MAESPNIDHQHVARIKLMIDAAHTEMDMSALPISLKEEVCSFLETASLILKTWAVDVEDQTGLPPPSVVDVTPPPIIEDPAPSLVD